MYTREEILNNYKESPFPKQLLEESSLSNQDILFHQKSKRPISSINKDTSFLSQSFVLPWRILQQQKNNKKNVEFSRGGSFTPSEPKEPLIEIKIENFKRFFEKFEIPLDKKIIYIKKGNNIHGPFNYDELENMYKNKKIDSNYEFRTIDLFCYSEEDPFVFHPMKNINEDNWETNYIESPLIEYTPLYLRVKALLEASKKRKVEVTALDKEITELKIQNEEKDKTIIELNEKIENLEKELTEQKNVVLEYNEKEKIRMEQKEKENEKEEENKEEDKKEEKEKNNNLIVKEEVIEIVEKNFLYSNTNNKKRKKKRKKEQVIETPNEEEEKEEIIEKEKTEIEFKPKVLDMGEEWEVAGKKKKKIEKVKEEPKIIPKIEDPKKNINEAKTSSNKSKKNQISGEELVEMLKPKKKEVKKEIRNEDENKSVEVKQVKGKGKKKTKRQYEDIDFEIKYK